MQPATPPARAEQGSPLTRLGPYVLLLPIGRGGMANVYLATRVGPAGFHKELVVKVLRPELTETAELLAMFMEEARLSARLNHANVVQTYEVGREDGLYFLAMEHLDGQPLHALLARAEEAGGLGPAVGLRIVAEVLRGLHYAHELVSVHGDPLGVVHRDVSPHNVFVTYDGQVKVVDFGIAKALGSSVHTAVGTMKGKVAYMPPEQCLGQRVDRRADIFGAGVVLWEILARRRMWGRTQDAAIAVRLAAGQIPPLPDAALEGLPRACADVLARALAADPADRYATAEDFRLDLERILAELGGAPDAPRIGAWVSTLFEQDRLRRVEVVKEQLRRLERGAMPVPASALRGTIFGTPTSVTDAAVTTISTVASRPLAEAGPRRRRRLAFIGGASVAVAACAIAAFTFGWPRERDAEPVVATIAAQTAPAATIREDASDPCARPDKPVAQLSGEIDEDATLGCDREYLLRFTTYVRPGATLTIEPGTVIRGDPETRGTLVVRRGGRIVANGRRDAPIVFTSARPVGERRPGDWGGVILLGRAPINARSPDGARIEGRVEGIDAYGQYGGDDPEDSNGVLRYVRIEYSGIRVAPNDEINGLTLAGVGRGTVVDHVQVRQTADDCFELFGGTVDARYLICDAPGDDGVDWDFGYTGRLQFVLVRDDSGDGGGTNGLEGDNDPNGTRSEPRSAPTIWNATLCGGGGSGTTAGHGVLVRRASRLTLGSSIVSGFHVGLEVVDRWTDPEIVSTAFFDQSRFDGASRAQEHVDPSDADDDGRFDEAAFLHDAARANRFEPIAGIRCDGSTAPRTVPDEATVDGIAPPPRDGFFDARATYLGAFRDADDRWDEGGWAVPFGP